MFGSGRGMRGGGGRGMGRMGGMGAGRDGECICVECGYKIPHRQGVPCNSQICPECGGQMTRHIGGNNIISSKSPVNNLDGNNIIIDKNLKAYVQPELCNGCKVCMQACSENAMTFVNGKVFIVEDKCTGCLRCIPACPFNAIYKK